MKALYRLLAAAFVCAAVCGGVSLDAMAAGEARATELHSGTSGDITWKIYDNGLLELTGIGDYELSYSGMLPPWLQYSSNISTAVVNISGITNTENMFYYCRNLTSLDLSKFDTSQVTNMLSMFEECNSLTSLDLSKFNTSQVTTMSLMFQNCRSLTSLDVSKFDTSQATTMNGMFSGCSSLTSLDLSKFNTSQVTTMLEMFLGCSRLASLDLSGFDTSKVRTMDDMFLGCLKLETLHTPKNVPSFVSLPSSNNGKRWYMGQSVITELPQNLAYSVKLVRQSTPPGPENPGGGGTSPNPGQQLPNTAAEDNTAFHIMMFGIFAGLAFCTYGLKRKCARGEGHGR